MSEGKKDVLILLSSNTTVVLLLGWNGFIIKMLNNGWGIHSLLRLCGWILEPSSPEAPAPKGAFKFH